MISVENLWKQYHYGTISHATLRKDFQSWWARFRGNQDPNAPISSNLSPFTDHISPEDDRFWALKDVSFEVKQGEVLGIIGKNGAGKSTLLKIMSRVTTPTKGQIKIKGRVASLLEVGTGFHPELTGRENIYLNGAILGMTKSEIKKKFDEIVDFAEIEKFIDTPVKRYSSGMYVRLAFAVAAHLEPEILLIDEVLAVGDAQFQKKCLGKMGNVAKEGRTILFVSHNMGAVQSLCSHALWLNEGGLLLEGDADYIVDHYSNSQAVMPVDTEIQRVICADLKLSSFSIQPVKIESGSDIEFQMEFVATRSMSIPDLALILCSSTGVRVGIVDLRRTDGPYEISSNAPLVFRGRIRCLRLVEGTYNLGLFIACGAIRDNFDDLCKFEVVLSAKTKKNVPYPSRVRGIVALEYELIS